MKNILNQKINYKQYSKLINKEKIPYYSSWIDNEELNNVTKVIKSNWLSEGKITRKFEKRLAKYCGIKYGIATNNATGGLIIALKVLGVGPGDEVIVPAFTFIASVNIIRLAGAEPVLVDVDEKSFTIDPARVEEAITNRTKAILPVHIFGHPAEMDDILSIAKENNIRVLEDCAQALGSKYKNDHVGTLGDIGCLSFYPDKAITIGEGGLLLTNSEHYRTELLMMKNDGRNERGMYHHDRVGYNLRTTDLQTAVGLGQLKKLDQITQKKINNDKFYRKQLNGINDIFFPEYSKQCFVAPHRSNILCENPQKLSDFLLERKIGTRRFYIPINKQPCYREYEQHFKITNKLYEQGLSLPSGPNLTKDQIDYVCSCIIEYFS